MQVHLYHSWYGNSWPISLKTVNDFNSLPPFGLFDIFNHLIYHSTDYDKQGIAAYESYDDSRLFNDGYMESLLTTQLKQEGVHVYVAKVKPFMKLKRDDRKDYSDLWFILEGRGANCGSVLQARCKCEGGRDGGCKHIAGAMYAVEDLLNTRGKDSVTSGPCFWAKRQACEVKDLVIEKGKKPSHEKRKCKQVYSQNIEKDVRANPPDEEYLWEFAKQMCHLKKYTWENPSWKYQKVGRRKWSCEVMSTSHPGGKRTTKCQGVGVVTWRECSQGISACCEPHSSQAKAHPKRLFDLPVQAFPWC